jgi:hypothetical protein
MPNPARTTCYTRRPDMLGFQRRDAWLLVRSDRHGVVVDKYGCVPLAARQARSLAAWLLAAALELERHEPASVPNASRLRCHRSHSRRAGKRNNASRKAMHKRRLQRARRQNGTERG